MRPITPLLRALLSLVEVALVVALLAHPFWLVVRFPNVAPFVADLYGTLVPWFIGMIILLVFRTPIETFLELGAKGVRELITLQKRALALPAADRAREPAASAQPR